MDNKKTDEGENENDSKRAKDRSPSPGVKSTAVVKYTAFQNPVSYARLQCNTDLNLPPSNWGAALDSYGLKRIVTRGTGLSSFRMAHMFPDCVGEVDVISGAECIKKLLKLPYQPQGAVSMMVHRVENTLLLDDFDVYDYLMKSEWSWLKDFFYENVVKTMSEQERISLMLRPSTSSGGALLTHKFLSHSVAEPPRTPLAPPSNNMCITAGPVLPEPETRAEQPTSEHLYNRNILWTFEDIHMLIGSDLPIFGNKDRPCVSLRLRDVSEPINVLTGLDYWLDNLMCNVPEVLMCYHLDGIVQKYEPMKTEDLPNMENSRFSPKMIRNVAKNILSFLKANATKAGHTYWLFKGPNEDVVKLYDLTSECPDSLDNPFTTPVAMLLYRVARNMRMTNRSRHVRQLLENALKLLKVERYPQIAASSHYMLADLFVPATTNPACPDFKDESSDSDGEDADYNYCKEYSQDESKRAAASSVVSEPKKGQDQEGKDNNKDKSVKPKKDKDGKSESNGHSQDESKKAAAPGEVSEPKKHQEQEVKDRSGKSKKDKGGKTESNGHSQDELKKAPASGDVSEPKKDQEREVKGNKDKSGKPKKDKGGKFKGKQSRKQDVTNGKEKAEEGQEKGSEKDDENDTSSLALQIRNLNLRDIGDRVRDASGGEKTTNESNKGLGTDPPNRCGKALQHALKGLLALHNLTVEKEKEEERERLKQQIIVEEQHPRMANPCEPIKMNYEPIQQSKSKEHNSRSRKKKRRNEKSGKYLIETAPKIDRNAIFIRNEKPIFPTWHESTRDDNFAWKLHLKTLLYEKICLAYSTLAEYSYSNEHYGFCLKYIDIASKCQKLLSNMIIKSKVVDLSCLIGRVGDSYFQLSKHWDKIEQYKKQFETDHETDRNIKAELERDLIEEVEGKIEGDFDLRLSWVDSETSSKEMSCAYYRRALEATSEDKRSELLRRLASVTNELALKHMHEAEGIYSKLSSMESRDAQSRRLSLQLRTESQKSWEGLVEAGEMFKQVNDVANLSVLYCNQARYLRFKAHCDYSGVTLSEKRSLYRHAEELYGTALKALGGEGGEGVRDLVEWEFSTHLYNKALLMQDVPEVFDNEVTDVAEAFKQALKHCNLSPGPKQHLYQFRAAMIYHRLGSLYHLQYRMTLSDGPKRRTVLNATRQNYEQAAYMFAALEDPSMYLTVQMEHVALQETQAENSPNIKLKSLQNALQILRQCHSILVMVRDRDPEDEPAKPEDQDKKDLRSESGLFSLYETRLHSILKSVIQYCRSKPNKDYEKMAQMYKKFYCASLSIKKNADIHLYAASICQVLETMDGISKEFE